MEVKGHKEDEEPGGVCGGFKRMTVDPDNLKENMDISRPEKEKVDSLMRLQYVSPLRYILSDFIWVDTKFKKK